MKNRIVIADDDGLVRDGLRVLFELEGDFEIAALCEDGRGVLEAVRREEPDLVLMDIRMPSMDGVQATRELRMHHPKVPIIILTTFRDEDYIRDALEAGASGYILKSRSSEQIIDAVRSALRGVAVFDKDVSEQLSGMLGGGARDRSREELGVSAREYEVLRLVGNGMTNKEIAAELFISEGTVRNHVSELLEKLDIRDRTQLALFFHNYLP